MIQDIATYLEQAATRLRRKRSSHPGLPATMRLRSSAAYQARDWDRLRELARDLIEENRGTIRLVRKHPDLFHPNVARSREAENRVYQRVVTLLDQAASA